MELLEKICLFLGEEMTSGSVGTSSGNGVAHPGTLTGDIAKFPEKFVVGYTRRKRKKKKEKKPELD